ncbi:MAG TPA: DUF1398 family protein [Holophagaceae bacterium]|nr:DUF1398 family protein [Holophagaceae bacterium]
MSQTVDHLRHTLAEALASRPPVGGFPHLAESLRRAGVTLNRWTLPACQSLYVLNQGVVVMQGERLGSELQEVPSFDEAALIRALRRDQAGEGTFPEFLAASWEAGVVTYEVDFDRRVVTYQGARGETYVEAYPAVDLP